MHAGPLKARPLAPSRSAGAVVSTCMHAGPVRTVSAHQPDSDCLPHQAIIRQSSGNQVRTVSAHHDVVVAQRALECRRDALGRARLANRKTGALATSIREPGDDPN